MDRSGAITCFSPRGAIAGFGKVFAILVCFVLFLDALRVAYETVSGWHQNFMKWGSKMLAFLVGFWPF
ncbi:hypothetical protein BPNPMPFG_007746 (plasmid) [Mesorhizobium sp. AR07]|uniref:hypothetical protein n=1 Tax=Mesorhizobium sp. AR07 TaxID=2865838 RepID=UPI00215F8B20|nr:hypothetical protein [Mesorhizobium sp. AR07]UVK48109.1 hypothetical protein BPNPMPFG_007746 [Mesorhizobium sp. AR07]